MHADTYRRILHRLRQEYAEAVMQETLDVLRGPGVGADALPTAQLEELTADLDAAAVSVISCGVPRGFERARGALQLLQRWDREDAEPTCGVVGHTSDCECATL